MKLSPHTAPAEPDNLLIRMHNQVGAAVDVTGTRDSSRWICHGCGERANMYDGLTFTRRGAQDHSTYCRAAYHRTS
ncbi:hypothetical protein [Streptomyces sp. NPDC090036]|uniref:hypothetical protein n=1 Tax=Streptomyces sp. NPDC090036 TaxID=3365926 RepID=UPI00382A27BE